MARARNIKPSFFTNEVLGTEDPLVGLTFIGLWCLADKDGILEDRPLRIKAELFPYREKLDVNRYLTVLERTRHIQRYEVNGNAYIKVLNFEKHQHPHHTEKARGYPQPPELPSEEPLTPLSNGYTPSDSLIPDSLIQKEIHTTRKSALVCLVEKGVDKDVASQWLAIRKTKKLTPTKGAIEAIEREAEKAGITLPLAIQKCVEESWGGFKASWLNGSSVSIDYSHVVD